MYQSLRANELSVCKIMHVAPLKPVAARRSAAQKHCAKSGRSRLGKHAGGGQSLPDDAVSIEVFSVKCVGFRAPLNPM